MAGRPRKNPIITTETKPKSPKVNVKSTKKKPEVQKPTPTCLKCGRSNMGEFYMSHNPRHAHYGKVPFCKQCLFDEYNYYYAQLKSPIPALFYLFQKTDTPLISAILNSFTIEELNMPEKLISKYYTQYNSFFSKQYSGYLSFDDTDVAIEDTGGYEKFDGEEQDIDIKEMQFKWGSGYSISEFIFLEKRYESLIGMTDEQSLYESDIMLFKEIAHAEANIRRLREVKADTTKQVEGLQKLMQSASIRSSDMKQAKNNMLKESYGLWLEEIEKYEPSEFFEKRKAYADFDGFLKYLKTWVFRPLKNLLSGSRDFDLDGDD